MIRKKVSVFIWLFIASTILLCSCTTVVPQSQQTSSPLATTGQQETEPMLTTQSCEPEPASQYTNIPYDLMCYVDEAISYRLPLDSFRAIFGEDSIRYAGSTAYTVVSTGGEQNLFVFFDVNNKVCVTKMMGNFKTQAEFLDYILGTEVTFSELEQFTPNYLWEFSSRAYADFYVQEGVFVLLFEWRSDGASQPEHWLVNVSFIPNSQIEYNIANNIIDNVLDILPVDRAK